MLCNAPPQAGRDVGQRPKSRRERDDLPADREGYNINPSLVGMSLYFIYNSLLYLFKKMVRES